MTLRDLLDAINAYTEFVYTIDYSIGYREERSELTFRRISYEGAKGFNLALKLGTHKKLPLFLDAEKRLKVVYVYGFSDARLIAETPTGLQVFTPTGKWFDPLKKWGGIWCTVQDLQGLAKFINQY